MAVIKQSEYEALAAFRYSLRQFLRFSEDAARALGLTPHQHQALLAIRGFPAHKRVSIGDLAERLQVRHNSAVELVNRLANEDLVVREESEEDHRRVYVKLTEAGSRVLEELSTAHKQELRQIGPELHHLLDMLASEE